MTAQPKPTRRRWLIAIAFLLTLVAVLWGVDAYQRHQRALELYREITNAGVIVQLKTPLIDRLYARLRNYGAEEHTSVALTGDTIDGEWLRQHDDLTALGINDLSVRESPLSGSEVARLVETHPIKQLHVQNVPDCDAIAKACRTNKSLEIANFAGSDLSDAGLQMLPLERIHVLCVERSDVTPESLQELRRCRQLDGIWLDGGQFDDSVADLLREQQQITVLFLVGEEVTDDHLARIQGMAVVYVELTETSVTRQGIAALQQALPKCRIRARNNPQPQREESPSD